MENEIYKINSSPIPYRIVCRLSLSIVNQLKFGLNLINGISDIKNEFGPILIPLLIYKNPDETLTISRNLCRHAGGNFVHDIEEGPDIVRCSYHGWKLNAKTLEYIKPSLNCLKQKELTIEKENDGGLIILESILYEPWLNNKIEKQTLKENEMIITFLNNSSIEIQGGNEKLIIDPSCGHNRWLYYQNSSDIFNRIANADAIFISKSSSDHFNLSTLKEISKINPNIPIYIPQYPIDNFKDQFKQLGFINIIKIPFGIWQTFKENQFRFLILPDHKLPNIDCIILIEYKGHQILNLIDSSFPNGDYLPYSVDVLLSNFTSNTFAFPSCFIEQFHTDENLTKRIIKLIQLSNPSLWIPVGNYFVESEPNDEEIFKINWKNKVESIIEILKSRFSKLNYWIPFPGGKFHLGTKIEDQTLKT